MRTSLHWHGQHQRAIADHPGKYSAAVLGEPVDSYIARILDKDTWGGAQVAWSLREALCARSCLPCGRGRRGHRTRDSGAALQVRDCRCGHRVHAPSLAWDGQGIHTKGVSVVQWEALRCHCARQTRCVRVACVSRARLSPRCHKAPPPLADGKEEDDERTFRPDDQDAAVGALQLAARVHKVCRFAVCTAVQCTCTPGVSKFWRGGANDCVRRATTGNLVLRLPPTPRERDSACSA